MKRFRLAMVFPIMFILVIAMSCNKSSDVRNYKEKSQPAPASGMGPHGNMTMPPTAMEGTAPQVQSHFKWKAPEGWTEEKATSSFRLATFTVKSGEKTATCTIIPLQGEAGGLKANVSRWLGQVAGKGGHTDPMLAEGDAAEVEKIMKKMDQFLTAGKFAAVMIDFTPFTVSPTDPSILATVVTVGGSSVFIKMTGIKYLLEENKAKFRSLCESFDVTAPAPETASPHHNAQ